MPDRSEPHDAAPEDAPAGPVPGAGLRAPVVIVGAGFGGLAAASALGRAGVRVTVIDRNNYHLFVPLLYQVATAALSPADITEPVRRVVRRYPSVDVVLGEVTGVDTAARQVKLSGGRRVDYDRLVLATGSTYSYFGHDEWAAFAPALKTVDDARRVRSRLLDGFERADLAADPETRAWLTTTIIVGGGPTGVELAGAIAELTREGLRGDFRRVRPQEARILLVEAGDRLLAGFPASLSDYARRRLETLGVEVRLGQKVEAIAAHEATIAGETVRAGTMIWAAGVKASPAARWLGIEGDRAGRIPVGPDLSVRGCEGVYAIGDTALCLDRDNRPLPGLAQVAKQQGQHLGRALAVQLRNGEPLPAFRFRNRGNAGVIGRNAAFIDFGRRAVRGWVGWVLWAIIHVWLLVGFENRLLVTVQWFWRYITHQHGARLIAEDLDRTAGPPCDSR